MQKKQKINCDVDSCMYQDTDKQECTLDEIKVSCECNNDECKDSDNTICDSFEAMDEETYEKE